MRYDGLKILVTGGAGFIGTNLIERLLTLGPEIRATIHRNSRVTEDERIIYVRTDLTNQEDCERVVKGVDHVFMCAASTSGAGVIASNPLVHVTPNVVMNARMLEASYLAGVKKFVWISSSVGYPPSGDRLISENEFFVGEPYPVYFASGWMKRYTEVLCRLYSEKLKNKMATVVLRPSNIYGPWDDFGLETSHATAALVRKVVERQDPIEVWGTGNDLRDLIYVDDFVDAMILAFEKIDSYMPLNVGSGRGYTVKQVLKTLLKLENYTEARVVFDKTKPSMIPKRLVDTQRAKEDIGFKAKTELVDGLEKTIAWYKIHGKESGQATRHTHSRRA